ncbi:MAG: COX15/CtaA family protein [Acidobacteriota bacterium]
MDRFTRYAWIVIAANLVVILWGAFVRVTGSGAGCGNSWPTCNGEIIPRSPSVETLIELSHRLTSGIALLMVVALLVWARRAYPPGHPVRLGAMLSMIFMLGEAAIGAGIVLFEMVADNASMARAMFMAVHLGNTFLLVGAMTLTAHWAGGGPPLQLRDQGQRLWLALAALGGTLMIGVSGAVAALGDTLFPSNSLIEALRQDFSPTSHVLIQLRIYHPLIAVSVCLFLLYYLGILRKDARRNPQLAPVRGPANALNLLIFVQLGAGTINVILLAPAWLQLVHLLLADLLWISLVLTCANSLAQLDGVTHQREAEPSAAVGAAATS